VGRIVPTLESTDEVAKSLDELYCTGTPTTSASKYENRQHAVHAKPERVLMPSTSSALAFVSRNMFRTSLGLKVASPGH
jgi:hypothetical protein